MKKHEETGIVIFENHDEQNKFLKQKDNVILVMPIEGESNFFPLVMTSENGELLPNGVVEDGELIEIKENILRNWDNKSKAPKIAISFALKEHFV